MFTIHKTKIIATDCGCECLFIYYSGGIGIKIYPTLKKATFAYERQKEAYKLGIAPQVLSNIDIVSLNNIRNFDSECVFGEYATIAYFYKTQVAQHCYKFLPSEIDRIYRAFAKLRFTRTDDIHTRNLGRIKGKLVVVDFGCITTSQWHYNRDT